MSGRPKLQQLNEHIEANGGDDEGVFDRIANGESIASIAKSYGVSRPYMYVWRKQGPPELAEERRRKWDEALVASADAHLEDGLQILDDVGVTGPIDTAHVSLANSQANYRKALAEMRDPKRFGRQSDGVNVNLNVGTLHLDALRAKGSPSALAASGHAQLESGPVVEAEVVDEDEGDLLAELRGE